MSKNRNNIGSSNNNGLDVGYYYLDKIGLMTKDNIDLNKIGLMTKDNIDLNKIGLMTKVDNVDLNKGEYEGLVDYNESRELFGRKGIVDQHNCYAYAFLYSFIHNKNKPQPGEFSHTYSNKNTHNKCYPYFKNIKNDNPHIYSLTHLSHCKKPYYHIFYFRYLSFICFFNSIARFFLSINSYLVLLSSVSSIFLVILFIISCAFCNFCFISSAFVLLNRFC